MSTDRKRLSSAIQRIAEQSPDIRQAIEATRPRGDQASAAGVGTSDAERDRVCCDGSTSDSTNPGTDTRDTSEGGQDGLNSDDAADISDMGPGSLTGLHDCATGEPINFHGSSFVPPEGWDAPNSPPIDENYDEGFYWSSFTGCYYSTPGPACQCSASALGVTYGGFRIESDGEGVCFNDSGDYATVIQLECPSPSGSGCNEDPPLADKWPSNGAVDIAIKNGTIVGSKFDPENDGSYSKPMSEIELCDDFGNSFYLSPSAGGGWKTINATKDAGYLWGSNGQKIAHINGNEYSDPDI